MIEDVRAALVILKEAMALEAEGHKFYLKAAKITQDEKGRETFSVLAADEQNHLNLIRKQRDSLSRTAEWIATPDIPPVNIDLSRPLFPRDKEALERTVTRKSSEWDAILFGLDIEIRSYDLYRKAASETPDPAGNRMFQFLAGQEQSHFDLLMLRYDALFGPVAWRH
ncbi:MAG: ferritin family protein [Chloroflexi bacterium]|nr:ferritin family protein [Chloroflexota bacterium]